MRDDGFRRACVLLVEGDPALRRLYRDALATEGYRVEAAASGQEALARMSAGPVPDAMVLELQGLDEITLMRLALDAHPALAVVLNAECEAFKSNFGTWGADRFVVKSSDLRELKDAVAGVLARGVPHAKAC